MKGISPFLTLERVKMVTLKTSNLNEKGQGGPSRDVYEHNELSIGYMADISHAFVAECLNRCVPELSLSFNDVQLCSQHFKPMIMCTFLVPRPHPN